MLEELRAALDSVGEYTRQSLFEEAERIIRGVLTSLEDLAKQDAESNEAVLFLRIEALNDLGAVQRDTRRYEESLRTHEQAVALAAESGNDDLHSQSLHCIAIVHLYLQHFDEALSFFKPALSLSRSCDTHRRTANILSNIGVLYYEAGHYQIAIDYFSESLPLHERENNTISIGITCLQIGMIYDDLLQHEKSLEYNLRSLSIFENLGELYKVGLVLNNAGFNYANLGQYDRSYEFYVRAIEIQEQLGNTIDLCYPYTNAGDVLRRMGRYEESLERLNVGLDLTRSVGEHLQEGRTLAYLARLYTAEGFTGADPEIAIRYTLEALAVFEGIQAGSARATAEIVKQHAMLAELYKQLGQAEEALHHFEEFYKLDKAVRSEAVLSRTAQFEQQISYAAERARHDATRELLHKTLPRSIAERIMQGEQRIADHFDAVSILFADVVGFTKLSSSLSPDVVLAFMNTIIERFDALAERHGCERIKTIGDGYMAMCGAPEKMADHAERTASLALDMMEDIILPDDIRDNLPPGTVFHLRIGLHCGEITAGLIGTGKLAYDVYGDAVNTASRMESHGIAGRIHVSDEFQQAVRNSPNSTSSFHFVERGEVEIKGKGRMCTYFLEKA